MERGILCHRVAGAGLGNPGEFTVPHDASFWVLFVEFLQQFKECVLLFLRASVPVLAFFIEATFIANAKRTLVVMAGMDALDSLGKNGHDVAIASDIIVVGGLPEAGIACCYEALDSKRLIAF